MVEGSVGHRGVQAGAVQGLGNEVGKVWGRVQQVCCCTIAAVTAIVSA